MCWSNVSFLPKFHDKKNKKEHQRGQDTEYMIRYIRYYDDNRVFYTSLGLTIYEIDITSYNTEGNTYQKQIKI